MEQSNFLPFPSMGEKGPQVCTATRFYLAVINDLPSEQVGILSAHIQQCEGCAAEFRLLQEVARLVAQLPQSTPSGRVDEAILARVERRGSGRLVSTPLHSENDAIGQALPVRKRRARMLRWSGLLVAALLLLILVGAFLYGLIFPANNSTTFQLPANLSWSGYVLHYIQDRTDRQGESYQVEVYQDLGTNQMHIESTMPSQFDVVVVTDASTMLGKDMMHHVAQMGSGVEPWAVDGSLFDLAHLRQDINAQRMTYLGKGRFRGQEVYQVRIHNDQVILLDMHYLPVTVLRNFTGSGTGVPLYNTYDLMASAQVSQSMWDMQVPPGFHMGELPHKS